MIELAEYNNLWRYVLPYCFIKCPHNRLKYVFMPVNRDYKPPGHFRQTHGREYVNYSEHPHQLVRFNTDPTKFADIWHAITPHLYADVLTSQQDYFARLAKLTARCRLVHPQADA